MQYLFAILMFSTAVFLILLVLVQRGRGGGLAGAFGGMGGQSAFGTKAGDLFTRVTMVVATFWILLCIASIAVLNSNKSVFGTPDTPSAFGTSQEETDSDPTPDLVDPTKSADAAGASGGDAAGNSGGSGLSAGSGPAPAEDSE
jgi:preprotein translocase subunit SecG